jgi:ABC-type multidrug transport system ATPase subunit
MKIEVEKLTKRYDRLTAVEAFSFRAEGNEIVALVGPDGAGKTSLFRSLCGLLAFDSGSASVAGFDVGTQFEQIKPLLGYMPQLFSLYPDLSVEENLRFYAGMFGVKAGDFSRKKEPLYDFSGLAPFRKRRAGNLSGGMKQKLALSCALIHDPKVLILDEPTTGVDPLSRRQFWEILKSLRDEGATIIVSTPYMDEVALSDRAIFIHAGHKLAEGKPEELTGLYRGSVYDVRVTPTTDVINQVAALKGLDVRRFGASLHVYADMGISIDEVTAQLNNLDIGDNYIIPIAPDLEDTFIQLMGER